MADWSALTDYKIIGIVILLVSTFLHDAKSCSPEDLEWWSDPCDNVRNVRHDKGDSQLLTQLSNAINHLENDIPQLTQLITAKGTRTHPIKKVGWLKFPKFNKKSFRRKNNKINLQALVEFHKALQIYGATIYTLINRTEIIDITKNNVFSSACSVLTVVSYEVKRLACEAEHEMGDKVSPVLLTFKKMRIGLRKKMPASRAHSTYIGILNSLKTFLKKSRNILFGKLWKEPKDTMMMTNEKQ